MLSGPLVYDNNNFTIGSLYVAPGVVFDIVGGSLTVLGAVDDEGTILVTGDPPALKIEGPLTIGSSGHLRVSGAGDIVEIDGNADNSGVIAATHRGKIVFDHSDLTNEGTLKADDRGTIKIKHSTVENTGKIEAKDNGTVTFDDADVHNNGHHAKIVASAGGSIDFAWDSSVINSHKALIEAKDGGTVWFGGATVVNKHQGTIEAADCGLVVFCGVSDLINKSGGKILAEDHGAVKFANSSVANDGGTIAAFGWGAKIELADTFIGGGTLKTDNGGVIETVYGCSTLDGVTIGCNSYLLVDACTTLTLSGGTTMDAGTLCIGCHGTLDIETCQGAMLDGVAVWNRGTIDVGESGRATLTLADGTSIHDGTLCIGCHGTLDIETCQGASLDGVTVWNRGTIDVGETGRATLTLADGTSVHDGTLCIGCTGTLDIETCQGASLDGVTVWNRGDIQVDDSRPATLTLADGTSIHDGTLCIGCYGTLDITTCQGANLDGVTVWNRGTIDVGESGRATLTLADGTNIHDGTLCIACHGTLDIETCQGASLDGVTVWNRGDIQVDDSRPATLTLADGTAIHDGTLCIGCHGTVDITTCQGATLDGVAVWNGGNIEVGESGRATLTLADGTAIHDGTLCIGCTGTLDIETCRGASLDGVTVWNRGDILVDDSRPATLTLADGTAIHDGTLCIGCHGTVDIATCQGATLDGVTVWNSGQIQVGDWHPATLKLRGDTSIGGDGTFSVGGGSTVIADENTAVSIAAFIIDNCGTIEASYSAALTLATSDSFSNDGTIEATGNGSRIDIAASADGDTVQNGGTIEATNHATINFQHPAGQPTLTIDNNGGTIEAIGDGATVALHHVTVDNTDGGANDGVIKAGGTSTVELFNGTDIIGGTISAFGTGVVEITNTAGHTGANVTFDGSETASGSIIQPLTINGAGDIQVDPDTSLTLQGTIANHGTIDVGDGSGGASLIIDATGGGVKLTGSGDIILAGDSQIEGNGTHHSPDTLENVNNTISGAGAIGDGSGDLTLINDANGPIDATGMLTIETGNKAITNTGTLEATGPTGHLIVASAVTGTGSVDIGNGAVVEFESTVSSHQTVTFSGGGYGELIIDDGAGFSGKIAGFTGTAADSPSLATTDEIDVTNIDYTSDSFTEHYNSVTGVLKISDGTTTAKLTFVDFTGTFQFATDGSNGTLIFDPPAANSASPSASQANDSFVFNTNANSGNTGASWDAGAHDHTDWAHTQREWSQIAGDMNGAPAAPEIAQHAESHWHYALHSAEHLH
ncbi:MAG: hypothetical protein KGK33_00680 [Hyphomicrobiales bacterium]|nr:hypothetical protein [Hyphomicrobiales bacterium]